MLKRDQKQKSIESKVSGLSSRSLCLTAGTKVSNRIVKPAATVEGHGTGRKRIHEERQSKQKVAATVSVREEHEKRETQSDI